MLCAYITGNDTLLLQHAYHNSWMNSWMYVLVLQTHCLHGQTII